MSSAAESLYVLPEDVPAEAVARSLQALLRTRHRRIPRHQFTLLDTFDGRVRRSGSRLTQTVVNGAFEIAWQTGSGRRQLASGLKQPVHFAWDLPGDALRESVASVVGERRLLAQVDAEERGALLELVDTFGKTVARVRIVSGRARLSSADGAWQTLPTSITLTPLLGYEDACRELVPIIESRPAISRCPDGAVDMLLRRVGAPVRGDLSAPHVELDARIRADVGARRIHRALLGLLTLNEPGVRTNLDTEFLHDFRVAIRRTRSLLRQIRGVFPADVVDHFSAEFSWIGRLTGPPRDLDVLVLALRRRREDCPVADVDALLAFLGCVRDREQDALVQALDSVRYRRLVSGWADFLERPAASGADAHSSGTLAVTVTERAWRLSRRIIRSAKDVDARTPAEHLHQIRIDAKKLRYLVDATLPCLEADDVEPVLGALKKLQRALGDFNDATVQEKRLVEFGGALGAAGGSASTLLTIGRLAEESRQRGAHLREHVFERLAQFRSRETRSACRRAFKNGLKERAR